MTFKLYPPIWDVLARWRYLNWDYQVPRHTATTIFVTQTYESWPHFICLFADFITPALLLCTPFYDRATFYAPPTCTSRGRYFAWRPSKRKNMLHCAEIGHIRSRIYDADGWITITFLICIQNRSGHAQEPLLCLLRFYTLNFRQKCYPNNLISIAFGIVGML